MDVIDASEDQREQVKGEQEARDAGADGCVIRTFWPGWFCLERKTGEGPDQVD